MNHSDLHEPQTYDAISTLSRSVEDLVARQRRLERTLTLNSIGAYVLFTGLLLVGAVMIFQSRIASVTDEHAQMSVKLAESRAEADLLKSAELARKKFDEGAQAFLVAVSAGNPGEILRVAEELPTTGMGAVEARFVESEIVRARAALFSKLRTDADLAFRKGQNRIAIESFANAERFLPENHDGKMMRDYGVALGRAGQNDLAVEKLRIAAGLSAGDDARFQLGLTLIAMKDYKSAKVAFEEFLSEKPGHRLSKAARRRVAQLRTTLGLTRWQTQPNAAAPTKTAP